MILKYQKFILNFKTYVLTFKGIIFVIWFYFFYKLGVVNSPFLIMYTIFSGMGLMAYNMNYGERQKGKLSAYSIFNKG